MRVVKKTFSPILAVFLFSLIVRLLYVFFNDYQYAGDSYDYLLLAQNLYEHWAFSLEQNAPFIPSVRRPPLYPFFLLILTYIQNGSLSLELVTILQSIIDSLTAVIIYWIVNKSTNKKSISLLAAIIYALHPAAIYATNIILTENFVTFLLSVTVFCLIKSFDRKSLKYFAAAGLFLGLTALCRPVFLPLGFIFPVIFFYFLGLKKVKLHATVFALSILLTISPWLVRGYLVSDRFVLIQGLSAAQFYIGSRHDLDQSNEAKLWKDINVPVKNNTYIYLVTNAKTPTEMIDADKIGRKETINNIISSPKKYLYTRLKQYPYLFLNSYDNFTGYNKSFSESLIEKDYLTLLIKFFLLSVFSLMPLLLAFYSLIRGKKKYVVLICSSIWIYNLLIHLPAWIEYRFWIPVLPSLFVGAGIGLIYLIGDIVKLQSNLKMKKT